MDDPTIVVLLTEQNCQALMHSGDLMIDVMRDAHLPVPSSLSLALGRLASALERQGTYLPLGTALGESRHR